MKLFYILTLLAFNHHFIVGQSTIDFEILINNNQININDTIDFNNEKLVIHKFIFYLMEVTSQDTIFHLIDLSKNNKTIYNPAGLYYIGVDSLTFQRGDMEGDLDPLNGMFWSWQSAYIHLKLEGYYSASNQHKHSFTFHIGGNKGLYNTCLPWNLIKEKTKIDISFLKDYFEDSIYNLMQPGKEAELFIKNMFNAQI